MKSKPKDEYLQEQTDRIESALERFLPKASEQPTPLHEAMRYSVVSGGKRIRPLLTVAVCDMLGGDSEEALIPACSIEFVHTYSLIHDDLPCLDNDEFRRGQPTCHKKFGEAIALLAGDGLLTLAFHLLGTLKDGEKSRRILNELSHAAGTFGMVGGQAMDLVSEGAELDLATLDAIHVGKTGQLIKVSCLTGAIMAGADPCQEERIIQFGEYLGFAFQIVDDILDGDGYLRLMSAQDARDKVDEIIAKAKAELNGFDGNERLAQIANSILNRGKERK